MIDRVLTPYVGISSDKGAERHIRSLKTIYADKAKVEKASIWINGIKVKFGRDLNHTVRNINKFYAQAGVRASVKDSKLVLSTRSNTLKIHDPKQILKSLVDKDRVGINKYHDIQIVRKGVGDAKFIYTFNNKSKDYRLDRDFSKSSTIYCMGGSSVHLQNPVDNLANVGVVQNLVHGQAPEPIFDVVVQDVEPIDFNVGALVPLQQNLSLENSREDAVLIPAAKFEIAKIVENLSMNGQEPEIKNVNLPEINHEIEPQIDENIDYLARAIELLNNKNKRETRLILTEVVKKGDINLIESMVQVIGHPPANVVINKPGFVGMKRVYNDSLTYSRTLLKREQSDNIKKTCGMIAGFARMEVGHARRVFYNLQGSRYSSAVLAG